MKHLKVADEPSIAGIAENRTDLYLLFPNHIQVEREEKAYTFLSLVADCGGVLGLFIGFNFLMVCEWILWCFKMYQIDCGVQYRNYLDKSRVELGRMGTIIADRH